MPRSLLSFAFTSLVCAGCEEEAILHPPPPPAVALQELSAAPNTRPASEPAANAASQPVVKSKRTLTLDDFMEDMIEPEMRKAMKQKGPSPELEALLLQLPKMVPEDPKFQPENPAKSWAGIVDAAIKSQKYGQSCKQCHALYKKPYKKAFHQREVEVE